MKSFFDNEGRFINNDEKLGYTSSRKYFYLDKDIKSKINNSEIYKNLKKYFNGKILITEDEFKKKLEEIENKVKSKSEIKNIQNCISIPFILPIMNNEDIGENLMEIFIPALKMSYGKKFPKYNFVNHIKDDLKNLIVPSKNSEYNKIIKDTQSQNIVGKIFLCLNEFSFIGAESSCSKVANDFYLSGPYEIMAALTAVPNLLFNNEKYPPLIWFSSVRSTTNSNIGFHIEPYGYNLTLNKRAHLNLVAEYWWHSLSLKAS
jgi:hypothetical protein